MSLNRYTPDDKLWKSLSIVAGLKDVDISKAQIGKFCNEAKSFVISSGIGELEFEADENEITLTVDVCRFS